MITKDVISDGGEALPESRATPLELGTTVLDRRKKSPSVGDNSEEYRTKKDLLVSTYRRFRKEEAEHYVRRCQAAWEAQDLPADIFNEFCDEVDLPRKSSMFRKARTIAKAADRLLTVADRLPDSKSAILELARLDQSEWRQLVENGELTPRITAAQARAAGPTIAKQDRCVIPVDVTALGQGERLRLLEHVQDAADQYGAKIKVPTSLREAQP